ncbi:fam-m protein [Plasmodium malariae]|uniref:Fam-m protein n=1 Tax=Plasmodium malariae TaxID=5858 RepID=A0A1D3JGR9_PLAMA|nr:fam-m protein [Plasmodium malariae]SBT85443.1 fam-m protein [Plasmodium malariae]
MERKNRLLFFIKFVAFIITWMYYFQSDLSTFNKSFCEIYRLNGKLNARTYRLLAKYKHDKNSNIVELKEGISNSGMCIRKYFSNNERETIGKKKQSNRDSLNDDGVKEEALKNKSCIFGTKKYSYFENKIFKELDNAEYLEKNNRISDKTYNKIKFKKRRLRFSLVLLLFILILVVPLIDLSIYNVYGKELLSALGLLTLSTGYSGYFPEVSGSLKAPLGLKDSMFREVIRVPTIIKYCIPILIIFVVLMLSIVYYYKKVMKYEKIKFMEKLKEY